MTPERKRYYRTKQVIRAIKICKYEINKGLMLNIPKVPKGFVYTIERSGGKFFKIEHRWLL